MKTDERRNEIIRRLNKSEEPISAKEFAALFKVSRQVIVQDIAVLRASLPGIVSTYRGYIIEKDDKCRREMKVKHGKDKVLEELHLIVDHGGAVRNVSISHRVYGRITAELNIESRQDVKEFLTLLGDSKSSLLGNSTSGYHYHLIEASCEERLDLIEEKLGEAGFLAPFLPWEKETGETG